MYKTKSLKQTKKIKLIKDPVTQIGYKIIHVTPDDTYQIWTQYHNKGRKPSRNRVRTDEAIRLEKDLAALIKYVEEELVGKHYKFYEYGVFIPNIGKSFTPHASARQEKIKEKSGSFREGSIDTKRLKIAAESTVENLGSKSEQLEKLFKVWEKAQAEEPDDIWMQTRGNSRNITKEHFRRDGIIHERTFEKEKTKILFISAEADDDEYSAATNKTPNTVNDYLYFNLTGNDDWGGKMRLRLAEIYKVISQIERNSMPNAEAALHFAVMDLNKRGGRSRIDDGKHIQAYCRRYADFICKEIEIISPDVVAFIGINLYKMGLHTDYLGAVDEGGKCFFLMNDRKIPILSLYQTSYFQGKGEVAAGYEDNRVIGKQVSRCLSEMKRFDMI